MNIEDKIPLKWPPDWERCRIADRQKYGGWKRSFKEYREKLGIELGRMGAEEIIVTFNSNPNGRGEPADCGVAVWFSKARKENYSWQDGLKLYSPAPSLEDIDSAYKALALKHHPDREGGNVEAYIQLGKYREAARAYILGFLGKEDREHEYAIPCDKYNEVRLNLAAIVGAVQAFRKLERVGIPAIMEHALSGLKAALPAYAGKEI